MKPSIPQGTRDFGPEIVRKRNYIFNTIREVFELYGFQPLETPAMENLETLMGKYGEEGDKLIFRILDSGLPFTIEFFIDLFEGMKKYLKEYEKKFEEIETDLIKTEPAVFAYLAKSLLTNEAIGKKYLSKLKNETAEKALRYDLTIPFARYVAMNHGQLTFPYKRYQMQPVWRADRPQKGRYREFYQCDADVVGSNSLLSDVEFIQIYADVFKRLRIDVEIKINSRKILRNLVDSIRLLGLPNKVWMPVSNKHVSETEEMINIAIAIDKLEKIGIEKVKEELLNKGLNELQIKTIENYLCIDGTNEQKIEKLNQLFQSSNLDPDSKKNGIDDLEFVLNQLKTQNSKLTIDFTLARGLNYYTGIIYEVKAKNISIGSISGGGRYDDLTGLFGVPNIPGVGISFGVDRIYDVMEELKLFPENIYVGTKVLFFNLGEKESETAFGLMQDLRNKNISCELFHENTKFDKQFKYADKKNIPFIVIIGSKELSEKTCTIKNLKSGEQQTILQSELTQFNFNQ